MSGAFATFGAGSFKVLVTNDCDRHPAWKWAEATADQLVYLDPSVTDPERARRAIQFRHWIIEILEPLFGQASRPSTMRCVDQILDASKHTPWEMPAHLMCEQIRQTIETNLNTIYGNQ